VLQRAHPSFSSTYIESHAALRGIAAFTVVMAHLHVWDLFPQWPWLRHAYQIFGWSDLAVFLFFILSGFVMSHVYPSPVRWRDFFVARLARLAPVYEVTLLVVCVLTMMSAFHLPILTADNFIANMLMIQQWVPAPGRFSINLSSWSLSIEAFLYVMAFPLLVWSRKLPWNKLLYIPLIFGGAAWAAIYYDIYSHCLRCQWELAILSGLFGFGIGFSMQNLMANGLRHSGAIAAVGAAFMACGLFQILPHGVIAPGLVSIAAATVNPNALPYKVLARPVFLYLGDISYSLYLWNIPILIFLQQCRAHVEFHYLTSTLSIFGLRIVFVVADLAVVLAISHLSYHQLEVPLRRLIRNRLAGAPSHPLNALVTVPHPQRCQPSPS
jgi:peptidoglycan/LPS O-acetylase OafA/YrhL